VSVSEQQPDRVVGLVAAQKFVVPGRPRKRLLCNKCGKWVYCDEKAEHDEVHCIPVSEFCDRCGVKASILNRRVHHETEKCKRGKKIRDQQSMFAAPPPVPLLVCPPTAHRQPVVRDTV
jgi:hypothetical protein